MEEDYNKEEFIKQVIKMAGEFFNSTTTVDVAIEKKKQEIATAKMSFELMWQAYTIVNKTRNNEVAAFKDAGFRMYMYAILVKMMGSFSKANAYEEIMKVQGEIKKSLKDLQEEKEFLLTIRKAIKELEKYQVIDCNPDISSLLSLINDKNNIMFEIIKDELKSLRARMQGFGYSLNSNRREELININESISKKANELCLIKKS